MSEETSDEREQLSSGFETIPGSSTLEETKLELMITEEKDVSDSKRGTWAKQLDFLLACVGFAVGLGNLWRFPYLCYKNGGGAFLIPYGISLLSAGIPLFMLELGLGQYMKRGTIGVWKIAPGFQGIGVASFVATLYLNVYYIVILAWAAFYLVMSFRTVLPWATCDNDWNTPSCFRRDLTSNSSVFTLYGNQSIGNATRNQTFDMAKFKDPVVEFWERKVLHLSDGIFEPGSIVPELAGSLIVMWIIVYFCVWRGVRWSGKVVYVTAVFPYVILTCLLIRGVTLDGAAEGLKFYFKPDFSRLADPQVWIDGSTQVFFSYAIGFGAMITLGSYNKFHENFYRHCFIISSINTGTSLYGGVAVFSVLGFMAKEQNLTVADVAESGPGLVFIAYPKAITQMPLSQFWAVIFFFMILLVGIDSQFVAVEAIMTPIIDMFPKYLYKMRNRMLVCLVYCAVTLMIGLSMVTKGGMYVFLLFDYYPASGLVLLWVCFWQVVVLAWVFGGDKFVDVAEHMTGRRIPYVFVVCWKFVTPVITMGMFLFFLVTFTPLTYNKTFVYPRSMQYLGLCMVLSSAIWVPGVFIYRLLIARGSLRERWQQLTRPVLKPHQIPNHWVS